MPEKTTIIRICFILLFIGSFAFATDSWESIGVSTAALGRGGAEVAVGDSALSQVSNPATLSLTPHDQRLFEASGQVLIPQVTWSTPIDSSSFTSVNPFGNVGVTFPINPKLTLGTAFYSKSGASTDYNIRPILSPLRRKNIYGDYKDVAMLFNAGYKLTDKLSLGLGLRAEVLTGRFGAVFGPADLNLDRVWAAGAGLQFGLHYQATKKLAFGLGYTSPSWMSNIGDGEMRATVIPHLPLRLGQANVRNWDLPQKIALGTAYDLTSRIRLFGEGRWTNFRDSLLNSTFIDTYDFPNLHFPLNLRFHDLYVLIAGAEFKLTDRWKISCGYNYSTNPVSNGRMFPLAPVPIQHHLTLGLRYERGKWWVGGGYIYGFKNRQSAPGWSDIPFGADFALSTFEHQQHSVFFGGGFAW